MMINFYDLKQSLVRIYRDYQYSAVVISTLAFTLGIALFLFTMVYTIEYKPLPAYQPSDIVWGTRSENEFTFPMGGLNDYDYVYIKQHQQSLDDFGALEQSGVTLSNTHFTEQFSAAGTSSALFRVLGVDAFMGRTLLPIDDIAGAEKTIVISYDIWKNTFNSLPSIIGETVKVNGQLSTIVGVMPQGFRFPFRHDMWYSRNIPDGALPENGGWQSIFGRLKPGVTVSDVDQEFKKFAREMQKDYPNQYKGKSIEGIQFTQRFSVNSAFLVSLLSIASAAILLMGCVSVSNLIIVRNLENAKEVLIKSALGLPIFRVVLSLLLETFWLCLIATAIGMWLTLLTINYLGENLLDGPYWWVMEFQWPIFLAGLCAAAFIWIATGVIPVWMALRRPTNGLLASGRKGGTGTALSRVMSSFTTLQILCAFILMVFTGVLMGGLIRMVNSDYGVPREHFLTAEVKLGGDAYENIEQRLQYYNRFVMQAAQIPGVQSAAVTSSLPGSWGFLSTFTSTEREMVINGAFPKSNEMPINETYFSTMDIKLVSGRNFTEADKAGAEEVAIINQSMADLLFPGESAVNRQFIYDPENDGGLLTVVGVVPDVVSGNPLWFLSPESKDWRAQLYRPLAQKQPVWDSNTLVIKTTGNPYDIVDEVKSIARTIDSEIPLYQIMSFDDYLSEGESGFRRMIYTFLPAAVLALLISALGIYGITRRVVIQNTSDIGIMKSLGIAENIINRKYILAASLQLCIAIFTGVVFSLFVLPQLPDGILITDQNTILGSSAVVAIVIACVVLVASYIPLIAAHKLSPRDAMNYLSVATE
jgi:predicted permease